MGNVFQGQGLSRDFDFDQRNLLENFYSTNGWTIVSKKNSKRETETDRDRQTDRDWYTERTERWNNSNLDHSISPEVLCWRRAYPHINAVQGSAAGRRSTNFQHYSNKDTTLRYLIRDDTTSWLFNLNFRYSISAMSFCGCNRIVVLRSTYEYKEKFIPGSLLLPLSTSSFFTSAPGFVRSQKSLKSRKISKI